MGRFVQVDTNNIVIKGVVVADEIAIDESSGIAYLRTIYDSTFTWRQTYKDGTRKNYAGIGFTYNADKDAFIPIQPYASWVLDDNTCKWVSPVAPPDDDKIYTWDEENTEWKEME